MARAIRERPDVLERHGERLYWSVWSALTHARAKGVPRSELSGLASELRELSRSGPAAVRALRSARIFRLVGVRAGLALQRGPG
jgi:hypothetical protein